MTVQEALMEVREATERPNVIAEMLGIKWRDLADALEDDHVLRVYNKLLRSVARLDLEDGFEWFMALGCEMFVAGALFGRNAHDSMEAPSA